MWGPEMRGEPTSYRYDDQRCLTDPSHQVLDADYYIATGNSAVRIEVTVVMLDDGLIERRWNGSILRGWNHSHDVCAHNRIPHADSTKGDSNDIRQQFSGRPDLAALHGPSTPGG